MAVASCCTVEGGIADIGGGAGWICICRLDLCWLVAAVARKNHWPWCVHCFLFFD